jgi:uncharacterized protein YuzE
MINLSYDKFTDAVYIRLSESIVVDSETIIPGIIYDYDENDQVVGIEILAVKKRTLEELRSLNFPFDPEARTKLKELFNSVSLTV